MISVETDSGAVYSLEFHERANLPPQYRIRLDSAVDLDELSTPLPSGVWFTVSVMRPDPLVVGEPLLMLLTGSGGPQLRYSSTVSRVQTSPGLGR